MLFFSKPENKKKKQVLSGVVTSGYGKDIMTALRRMNIIEISCTLV
jgi:hypothetical protein